MSNEEAAEAFAEGNMSRRRFIRTLVRAGVGFAVASTYAEALAKPLTNQAAGDMYDHYEFYGEFYPPGHGGTPPGQGGTPPGQTLPPGRDGEPPGQM